MSPPKKPIAPETHDSGGGWYAKMLAWEDASGHTPHWSDQLTPAEERQYQAEENWAGRARREGLPGPVRIGVFED